MNLKYICISVAWALFPICLSASEYDDIVSTILQNNLELKRIEASVTAQQLEIKSERNLEDPTFEGKYLWGKEKKYEFDVSQSFDFPTIYSAKSKLRKAQTEAVALKCLVAKQKLVNEIKCICDELVYYNKQKNYHQQIKSNFDSLYNKLSKALTFNEVSILDVNKLKLELINIDQRVLDIDSEIKIRQDRLVALNGGIPLDRNSFLMSEYQPLTLKDLSHYLELAQNNNYDLHLANKEIDVILENYKTTKMGWIPKLSVGYSHAFEEGMHLNGINFGVSIPLFKNQGKVNVAKAKHIEAIFNQENKNKETESIVVTNYNKAQSLKVQLQKYQEYYKDDRSLIILTKAVEGREISMLNYLNEVSYYLDAMLNFYKVEFEFNQQLTLLNYFEL